jgi:hypothetical protein
LPYSLSKISLSTIVVEPITSYLILVKDPNLGTFATMHNGPNVCEEKAEKGRISNGFNIKVFDHNGEILMSIKLVETFHGPHLKLKWVCEFSISLNALYE